MDREELLNWGAQAGNRHGQRSDDQRQSNGEGSREPTSYANHTSSPGHRNGAGGNTIESVWGNLGFDKRFDNQTKNQRQTVNGSATSGLGAALQELGH